MEASQIKQQVRRVFDPLASRLCLSGPIELFMTPTNVRLGYVNKAIGLEIEVEMIDFFIYVLIFKPSGNGLPIGYHDETGRRHKLYIHQALKELSIDVIQETTIIQRLGGDFRNCQQMAEMLSQLVERYWPDLSRNSTRWWRAMGSHLDC